MNWYQIVNADTDVSIDHLPSHRIAFGHTDRINMAAMAIMLRCARWSQHSHSVETRVIRCGQGLSAPDPLVQVPKLDA